MIKKILLSIFLSATVILSVSIVDLNCNMAVFYWLKPWLIQSNTQILVKSYDFLIVNFFVNIALLSMIILMFLYKMAHIQWRWLFITLTTMLLSGINLFFLAFSHLTFRLNDDNYSTMNTQFIHNEPFKTQISFLFSYHHFSRQECERFF